MKMYNIILRINALKNGFIKLKIDVIFTLVIIITLG